MSKAPLTSPSARSNASAHSGLLSPAHNVRQHQVWPHVHDDPHERMAAIHSFGEYGGVNKSIENSTTFTMIDAATMPLVFSGQRAISVAADAAVEESKQSGEPPHDKITGCFLYGRHFNPTVLALAHELAAMEGTQAAYCTSSGLAAISSTVMQLCNSGDHVVSSNTVYGGTFALLSEYLPLKCGISVTFVDIADLEAVRAAITPKTKLIYAETVANPTLVVCDVPGLSEIAKSQNPPLDLVIDNTFSPLIMNPAKLGATIVVHSITKFINGASDFIAGCICGSLSFIQKLMDLHTGSLMLLGPTMDPLVASQISLRLPHLSLRIKEHSLRAQIFAERLEKLKLPVRYPGLPSHPQHELFKKQMNPDYGFGGMLTLDMGSTEDAFRMLDLLQNKYDFGYNAVSLGYFHTLMSCSGSTTSSELTDEQKKKANIQPGTIRFSLGYTGSVEQRWKQMENALKEMKRIKE